MENSEKRKMMEDALTRLKTRFRASSAPARKGILDKVKRQVVDVNAGLKTVSQIGWRIVGAGAALYAAHIRQMDAGRRRAPHHQPTPRGKGMRGVDRDYA